MTLSVEKKFQSTNIPISRMVHKRVIVSSSRYLSGNDWFTSFVWLTKCMQQQTTTTTTTVQGPMAKRTVHAAPIHVCMSDSRRCSGKSHNLENHSMAPSKGCLATCKSHRSHHFEHSRVGARSSTRLTPITGCPQSSMCAASWDYFALSHMSASC